MPALLPSSPADAVAVSRPPRLLAFDTATERLIAAVCGGPAAAVVTDAADGGAQASATLLPRLHALLARAGLTAGALQAVAFGRGPGAFTGVRTAASVAQGLAFGLDVPVLPLDSLLIVAEDAHAQCGEPPAFDIGVAMDARMDEAYAAGYRWQGGRWHVVDAPALRTLGQLQADWDRRRWPVVAGSALAVFGDRLRLPPGARVLAHEADRAAALARLALRAWADGGIAADAAQALPLYLRDQVALTTAERAAAAAAAVAAANRDGNPQAAGDRARRPAAAHAGPIERPRRRAMTAADLEAVHRIEVTAYSHPWSRGNFADSLHAGHLAEVLELPDGDERTPVGYFVAQIGVDELHLLNVTVAPAHQGRGWGRLLMAAVQAHGRRLGLGTLWLEVRHGNARARALYRRLGFDEVGVRRGYYPAGAQREDAVVMRRVLRDAGGPAPDGNAPAAAPPPSGA